MRITGGQARGRKYSRRIADGARPPLARLRQSLFSILESTIDGGCVLDLFAGAGTFGLESVSRGARRAVFVESDPRAVKLLEQAIEELAFRRNCVVVQADALSEQLPDRLAALLNERQRSGTPALHERPPSKAGALGFDAVFVDPPFALFDSPADVARLHAQIDRLLDGGLIPVDGVLVLRCPSHRERELRLERQPASTRDYGKSVVYFFRPEGAAQ